MNGFLGPFAFLFGFAINSEVFYVPVKPTEMHFQAGLCLLVLVSNTAMLLTSKSNDFLMKARKSSWLQDLMGSVKICKVIC